VAFKKALETSEWKKFAEDNTWTGKLYGAGKVLRLGQREVETLRAFMKTFGMIK